MAWAQDLPGRIAVAGNSIWFYLEKLIWPYPIVFIYPRWPVSSLHGWALLFPATAGITLAGLWGLRKRLGRSNN